MPFEESRRRNNQEADGEEVNGEEVDDNEEVIATVEVSCYNRSVSAKLFVLTRIKDVTPKAPSRLSLSELRGKTAHSKRKGIKTLPIKTVAGLKFLERPIQHQIVR